MGRQNMPYKKHEEIGMHVAFVHLIEHKMCHGQFQLRWATDTFALVLSSLHCPSRHKLLQKHSSRAEYHIGSEAAQSEQRTRVDQIRQGCSPFVSWLGLLETDVVANGMPHLLPLLHRHAHRHRHSRHSTRLGHNNPAPIVRWCFLLVVFKEVLRKLGGLATTSLT